MARWKKPFTAVAAVVAVCTVGGLLTGFVPAEADAVDGVTAIQQVAPEAVAGSVGTAAGTDEQTAAAAETNMGSVSVPTDAANGIQLTAGDAHTLTVGLPFAKKASDAAKSHVAGVVVYDNNNGSSTVPVIRDGGVQINTVIDSAGAPKRYDYPMSLPAGQSLHLNADGSVVTAGADGAVSAYVEAPWAKDANGTTVPTHYEVNDTTLTQVINHTTQNTFPIVADPTVTWLWWGRTVKYSKAETKEVADFASAAQMFSYLCIIGGLAGAACTTVANLGLQIVKNAATNALKAGRCIQLNVPYVGPGLIYDVKC